ncbi:hypothetical protein SAMN05519104_7653 [Rhizobiales bacterium GAS188]|nr:hypothetical protein SAMN05519104_7653 [Rhizobiales bacterium GAS188]
MADGKRVADLAEKARIKFKEAASKRQTAGPMEMQPKRQSDIEAGYIRRDELDVEKPQTQP